MKLVTSLLLISYWVSSLAQTNSTPAAPEPASLPSPAPELQTPPPELETPAQLPTTNSLLGLEPGAPWPKREKSLLEDYSVLADGELHDPAALNSEQAVMLRYHERLKRAGYLTRAPAPPEDLFSRTVNAMFQPEPVRVGRTTVAFSPVTAIKRKNPLALLNPIVLNISW